MNLYDWLTAEGLLPKLTRIILAKANTPRHLTDDARQAAYEAWAKREMNPAFERDQIACYAYRMGVHSVLKLRRELGAAVKLPGTKDAAKRVADLGLDFEHTFDIDELFGADELAAPEPSYPVVPFGLFYSRTRHLFRNTVEFVVAHMVVMEGFTAQDAAAHMTSEAGHRTSARQVREVLERVAAALLAPESLAVH
jgi:hypothetical protein